MTISFEERFFDLNRILLLAVGIWPYQQSKLVQFQVTFSLGIIISFIVFQLSRLLFVECTFDFVTKILCISLLYTTYAMIYIIFWNNLEIMRCLLEQLQYTYDDLRDKNEIAIYDKYGNIARRTTIVFIKYKTVLVTEVCCIIIGFMIESWSKIVNIVLSNNKTYGRHPKAIISKHFNVHEKYFYIILLHLDVSSIIGTFATLAASVTILSYIIHMWGIFKIASYRLERAMTSNTLQDNSLNGIMIYKEIIAAIDIHRKAIHLARYLERGLENSFLCVMIITVLCMSCTLYRIIRVGTSTEEAEETIAYIFVAFYNLLYMFLINYAGQEITDYNNDVFVAAYDMAWYRAPLHIQKLILFLLQRRCKTLIINIAGMFTLSIEFFASLTSASISYLAIMLSVQ